LAEEIKEKEGVPKEESISERNSSTEEVSSEGIPSDEKLPEGQVLEESSSEKTPPAEHSLEDTSLEEAQEGSKGFSEAISDVSLEPEDISDEFSDELIKALEEEVREKEAPEIPQGKKSKFVSFLMIIGLVLGVTGIGVGIYTLWKLVKTPSLTGVPPDNLSKEQPQKPPVETPKEPLGAQPIKPMVEYSVVLKHFLIPLQSEGGAPVFIKATVVLYFEDQRQVLLAKKLKNPLRGIIFDAFKNIPFYYWRSREGIFKVREALLETLKKKAPQGLYPKDIEVTGYILK